MLERCKLVVLTLLSMFISLGVIELCRRLGHEAFGEEDDEASDFIYIYIDNI